MYPATVITLPRRGLCSHHIVINRLLDMHFLGHWQSLMYGVEGSIRNPSIACNLLSYFNCIHKHWGDLGDMVERWNPFILKGLLTPGAHCQQHLSMTAFNNMVIVLLIRVLLQIWHLCYVLIELHIIFWHIFYEIMTAINLITIIFSVISVLMRFVGECSIRLGRVVTHALSGTVAQCMTLMEATEMANWASVRTPLLIAEPPSFVLGSDYHY